MVADNDTLVQRNYLPPVPGALSGAIWDPLNGFVYVGDSDGYDILGINGSTGLVEQAIRVGWDPANLAWDSTDSTILVATGGALLNVDPATGIARMVVAGNVGPAAEGSMGLAFDPENGFAYAADFTDNLLLVINVTSGSYVTNISVPVGPQTVALDPTGGIVFVGSGPHSSVSTINTSTESLVGSPIGLGSFGGSYPYPNGEVFDSSNDYLYVCSSDSFATNTIVIDASNLSILTTNLSTGPCLSMTLDPADGRVLVGGFAGSIAVINGTSLAHPFVPDAEHPAGLVSDLRDNHVFAANSADDSLTEINASSGAIESGGLPIKETFAGSTYDAVTGQTYVATPDPGLACFAPGRLSVVDSSTYPHIVGSVPVGYGPLASVVSTRSADIFVVNACSNNVTEISSSNDSIVHGGIPVGAYPYAVEYDPATNDVWVANAYSDNLTILNGTTGAIVAGNVSLDAPTVGPNNTAIPLQPAGIAIDPASDRAFVTDYAAGNVTELNATSFAVLNRGEAVGTNPQAILYDQDTGMIIVDNVGSDSVSVINGSSGVVAVPSIPAGVGPVAMALDPTTQTLYVADAAGGAVDVVNLTNDASRSSGIPVNSDPQGISYDPESNQVDVSDFLSGTISIVATIPQIQSFSTSPSIGELGEPLAIQTIANESDGAPLGFQYVGLPTGCASTNASNYECLPSLAGTFRATVTVTDSVGYRAWSAASMTIDPQLMGSSLVATPPVIELGENLTLVATAGPGGVGPPNYAYSGLPGGCVSANSSTLRCAPNETGVFGVLATITDADGARVFATAAVTVAAHPTVAEFLASPTPAIVNTSLELIVDVVGGVGPFQFIYSGLPPGCTAANSSTLFCAPASSGTFNVTVRIDDDRGYVVKDQLSVTVNPAPSPPALRLLAFIANPATIVLGASMTFEVFIEGGTSPLRFTFSGLPSGCPGTSNSTLTCVPKESGQFSVRVTVIDALGSSVIGATSVDIGGSPTGTNSTAPLISVVPLLEAASVAMAGAVAGGASVWGVMRTREGRRTGRDERPKAEDPDKSAGFE